MNYPQRLLGSFRELSRLVLSQETVTSTLDVISDLAVDTIPSCDVACVSLVKGEEILTVGSSAPVALNLDQIQYETQEGPCLDAINRDAMSFQVNEMSLDTRWPRFSPRAAEKGFESLLAFTLRVDADTLGALNLYAHEAHAFSEDDRDFGAIYAAHAAVALANAQASARSGESHQDQDEELLSQEIIGRAVGILMEGEFRSADDAIQVLQDRAETLHLKLKESAQEVIASADKRRADLALPEGFADRMMGRTREKDPSLRLVKPLDE